MRTIITALSLLVIALVGSNAWKAWERCALADRVSDVAETSKATFSAMNALRFDRARSLVGLQGDKPLNTEAINAIEGFRATENAALQSAAKLLAEVDFKEQAELLSGLRQRFDTLTKLQAPTKDAFGKAKDQRPAELIKVYPAAVEDLLTFLDTLNARLTATVKHGDPMIDQLLSLKELAWNVRNTSGSASTLLTTSIPQGRMDPAVHRQYIELVGGIRTAWLSVEIGAAGERLPASVLQAIATAKSSYFTDSYSGMRERIVAALVKGEKPELDGPGWADFNYKPQDTLNGIATAALEAASERADTQMSAAYRSLTIWSALLAAVVIVGAGLLLLINRRIIAPIGSIETVMRRLADGDLTVETPYRGRGDEIGALADAFDVFHRNAIEKQRIEGEQQQARDLRERRTATIEQAIGTFEQEIMNVLGMLANSSSTLKTTAGQMSDIATASTQKTGDVAVASQQASANVQAVAAATEELAYSIREIGQQVTSSQSIARQAVREAEATNGTVNSLVEAAAKVDDIVGLIQSIASQTNLLALNATIEAARAGEAGKGFAVVANEVKHLATQTAQATEQISHQIQSIQTITTEAAKAIHGIGGTIVQIDEISTTIAAAVEEQNAATSDIARNVDQAARGASRVSDSIADVTEAAIQTGCAADQVLGESANADRLTGEIRSHVADFLQQIRMA